MKNKLLLALFAGSIIFFASCDKDVENTDLKINLSQKAPLKAYVYAQLDRTKAGFEFAPAGTKVVISIDHADMGLNIGGKWSDTVFVDNNGTINAMVPVDNNGVNVTISPIAFEADQVLPYGSNSTTAKMIFTCDPVVQNINLLGNAILQIKYKAGAERLESDQDFINTTITIEAELDNSMAGFEKVLIQDITLYTNEWTQKYNSGTTGEVAVRIPAGQVISYDISFVSLKKVPDPDVFGQYKNVNYEYKVENGVLPADGKINLGDGTEVK